MRPWWGGAHQELLCFGDRGAQGRRLTDHHPGHVDAAVAVEAEHTCGVEQGQVEERPQELVESGSGMAFDRGDGDSGYQHLAAVMLFLVEGGDRVFPVLSVVPVDGGVEGGQYRDYVREAASGEVASQGRHIAEQRRTHMHQHLRQHPTEVGGEAGVLEHGCEGGVRPHREPVVGLGDVRDGQVHQVHQRGGPLLVVQHHVGAP